MISLRNKLSFAFGGMLIILITVGILSGLLLTQYSSTIQRIFRENYDSVVYAQKMKDSVDDLNARAERLLWDENPLSVEAPLRDYIKSFEENLAKEKNNVTLPGERELAADLERKWQEYKKSHARIAAPVHVAPRRAYYLETLLPLSRDVKQLAQQIIDLNLATIVSVDGQVQGSALVARRMMGLLVLTGVLVAIILTTIIMRAIIRPLKALTESVHEIERGNLDLTVTVKSNDEIGQLAEAFNAMAVKLREFRSRDRAKLFRLQRTTQLALNTFPDAVVVVSPDGKVELANEVAQQRFKLAPGTDLSKVQVKGLWSIFQEAFTTLQPVHPKGYDTAVQIFSDNQEHFYLPQAVPIVLEDKGLAGVTLVLADVTDLRRLDEMKSGLLSVVSHELKTPLTSIRMATHLLLDERIGALTPKQCDLVVTARDDAERLNTIIEKLLDIGRIESGKALMEMALVNPETLISQSVDQFTTAYRDRGVTLETAIEPDLPAVLVDTSRIALVFANLLDNALKHTASGGKVTLAAQKDSDAVRFVVSDTGRGIPEEYLPRIFDRFFRAPNQGEVRGAGLGLAIAKEIVEAHGGTITASSQLGIGSIFCFTVKVRA